MERDEATSSKGKGLYEEEGDRGAGGKFRKPTVRKPPTTPYARPSTQTLRQQRSEDGGGGGWLSKIVNPATRLISGGATRLFPSFFSKPLPVSDEEEEEGPEEEHDVSDGNPEHLSNVQIYRSTERRQSPASKRVSDIDENVEDKLGNSSDAKNFSEIEQMMKGKTFSRDDINRLTEILRSRIADRSDHNEREQNILNMTTGVEVTGRLLGQENVRTSLVEKHSMFCQENIGASVVEKQVSQSDKVTGAMSTPGPGPFGQDKVGASPIDIAKAYMGARTSELGLSSPSVIFRDERTPLPTDGFSLKPSVPSPSPKSSICWPGAKVQDQRAYQTPQTQRGRIGLHNLPRTPYSRAVHPRSTSKLQDGGDYWKHSRTPIFCDSQAMRARSSDDGSGSVGPMRRMRNKFVGATPSKGAISSRPSNSVSFRMESSDAPIGFSPMVKQNLELGGSLSSTTIFHSVDSKAPDSSVGGSSVHPQSSEMARKILEGLDRSIITPQEKSAELKRATLWRKTTSSELTTSVLKGQFNEQLAEGSNMQRSSYKTQQCSAQRKEMTGSSLCEFQSEQSKNDKATDVVNPYILATNGGASSMTGNNGADSMGCSAKPFMELNKTHNAPEVTGKQTEHLPSDNNQLLPLQNHIDEGDVSRLFRRDGNAESLNGHKRTAAHTFGNKPALTSIDVVKADPKRTVSFDNGSGFTFPVSASGTLSEPPTPSIMPSFSAIGVPRPLEKPALPPYGFGSKATDGSIMPSVSAIGVPGTLEKPALPPYGFGSKATDGSIMPSVSAIGLPRTLEKPALPPYGFDSKATDGSIMPSVSAVGVLRPLEKPALPSYIFGSKTGTRPIVFSFPCTSSSSPGDGSTPKFDFGSDKKSRLSFRSVDEDSICY